MAELKETLTERGSNYGPFKGHARITQLLKILLKQKLDSNESYLGMPHYEQHVINEALDMICHKLGRIVNGNPLYLDSWHDIAGYATLVETTLKGQNDEEQN